jgi:hypothetical protein
MQKPPVFQTMDLQPGVSHPICPARNQIISSESNSLKAGNFDPLNRQVKVFKRSRPVPMRGFS